MTSEFSFHSGAAYRNGKLYEFTRDCVIVMKGWPEMRAWQWTGEYARPWRHVRPRLKRVSLRGLSRMPDPDCHPPEPNGQMLFPFAYSFVARHAYRAFWWAVPEAYRELVMPFRDRRWHMLSLLARCPGADDLTVSNPALAFCLASNWAFHVPIASHPLRAARSLVFKKQRHILEWLGYPGTESGRQLLRRIPRESLTVEFLTSLRAAIQSPEVARRLSFMDRISQDVFYLIATKEIAPHVAFSLLDEVSQVRVPDAGPVIAFRIRDMLNMSEELQRKLPRLRSVAQVDQLHEDLVFDYNLQREAADDAPLPPPPIAGKEGEIEPLETCQELAIEGRLQQHCVGSYAHSVRRGQAYVYRMLKPERATLAIMQGPRGWTMREIHGYRNADVRPETCQAALDWLNSRQPLSRSDPVLALTGGFAGPDDLPF